MPFDIVNPKVVPAGVRVLKPLQCVIWSITGSFDAAAAFDLEHPTKSEIFQYLLLCQEVDIKKVEEFALRICRFI